MKNPLRGGHGIDLETLARRVAPTISAPRHEPAEPPRSKPEIQPEPTAAPDPPLVSTPPMPLGEFSLNFASLEPPRFEDTTPERPAAKPVVRQEAAPEPARPAPDPVSPPQPEPVREPDPDPEPEPVPDPEPDRDPEPAPFWLPPLVRSSGPSEPPPVVEPKEKKVTVYPSPNPTPYDHEQPGASRIPPDQRRPEFSPQDLPPRPEGRKVSDLDRVFAMLQQALNASTAVDQTAHSLKARLYGESGEFHGPEDQFDHGPMIPRLLAIAEMLRDQSLRAHAHLIDISRVA